METKKVPQSKKNVHLNTTGDGLFHMRNNSMILPLLVAATGFGENIHVYQS